MEGLIPGPFAAALEAGRPRFNALFAQARRANPRLDPDAFSEHLRSVIAPIVEPVARVAPDRTVAVVDALFELSLELVGQNLPGRYPALAEGWQQFLCALPTHLAAAPRRFAGSVANALYQLSMVPQARPAEWVQIMCALGPLCTERPLRDLDHPSPSRDFPIQNPKSEIQNPDVASLLEAGKVAAWRAGLAHFREGALETCRRLEPPLARAALGLPATSGPPLDEILQQLQADPWLRPASLAEPKPKDRPLRIVARVGAFRGFGGAFLCPPRVAVSEGRFYVADSEACWLLTADCFGATLHRVPDFGLSPAPSDRSDRSDWSDPQSKTQNGKGVFQIERGGKVTARGQTQRLGELSDWTSAAADETTLAVTIPLSHAVLLVAFGEQTSFQL